MSTQPASDLKSTVLTRVSRNAMNPLGAKDLTALAATLLSAGPSAREALTATAPRGKRRTREGWKDDLASAERFTVALQRARDRAESVNRARRPLLAGAHRDLREPLTALLRLNSDWNVRATDNVALAVIKKARLLLGYNVPAVLLTTQASIGIGEAALVTDVSVLANPVNLDELNTLIGEVLKRPRRSRLAQLRTTGAKLGHDEPHSAASSADRLLKA